MTGKRKPVIREYTVESSRVTDTVRLILLADYHDSDYGAEQELLVDRVAELSPDAVLMAGDMADCLRSHERVQQLTDALGLLFAPALPPATSGCRISFFRLRTDLLRPCPWRADPPAGADQWAVCTRSGVVSALCWRGLFLGTLHIGG